MINISLIFLLSIYGSSTLIFYLACKKKCYILYLLSILIPIAFAYSRVNVGTDYLNYLNNYYYYSNISLKQFLLLGDYNSIGQFVVAKIAGLFNNSNLFFGIFGFIILYPFSSILFHKRNYFDSTFIYFLYLLTIFTSGLNIMKQMAALSIFLLSTKYIYNKNLIRFLLVMFVASLFHATVLVLIPTYFLWDKRHNSFNKSLGNIFVFVIVFILFFWRYAVVFLANYFSVFKKFLVYANNYETSMNYSFFLKLLLFCFTLLLSKNASSHDKKHKYYIYLAFIGLLLEIGGFSMVYFKRLSQYFYTIAIICVSSNVCKFSNEKKIRYFLFSILFLSYFIVIYYVLGQADIITSLI